MTQDTFIARGEDHVPTNEAVRGSACDDHTATFLGLFSLGLGAVEVVSPNRLARAIGIEDNCTLIRAYGAREIAAGAGILTHSPPTSWLWSRVAGDVVDLATLAVAPVRPEREAKGRLAIATAAVVGVTLLDIWCAMRFSKKSTNQRTVPASGASNESESGRRDASEAPPESELPQTHGSLAVPTA